MCISLHLWRKLRLSGFKSRAQTEVHTRTWSRKIFFPSAVSFCLEYIALSISMDSHGSKKYLSLHLPLWWENNSSRMIMSTVTQLLCQRDEVRGTVAGTVGSCKIHASSQGAAHSSQVLPWVTAGATWPSVSSSYCYVTNYPRTQWLQAISIYYCPQSMDQVDSSSSLAGFT